mmetsp:Transcript_25039/g.58363  ORF Transcript_25039/g.58363 Transcript_25039/m.58363 type:complete len:226 (-) Transcript_25039:820-1497(-)
MHAARCECRVVLRNDHLRQSLHVRSHALAIGTLQIVVELLVKVGGELVDELANVKPRGERRGAQQPAELASEVQVERDGLEHKRSLHLDGHLLLSAADSGLVHLSERGGCHRRGGDIREDLVGRTTQLICDGGHGQLRIERWHLVAQLLQLDHRFGREDVGADGESLSELDEEGTQRHNHGAQLRHLLDFCLRVGLQLARRRVEQHTEQPAEGGGGHLCDARQHG